MNPGKEMSFLDHLEELRWHILRSTAVILVVAIAAFIAKDFVFNYIVLAPRHPDFITYQLLCNFVSRLGLGDILCFNEVSFSVTNIEMAGQFLMHIKVSFIVGLVVSFPYVFIEIWRFVSPALHPNERKNMGGVIFFSSMLFYIGILFGYLILTPFSINFLGNYNVSEEVRNDINLSSYISTVVMLTLASGFIFELPIVTYFLAKLGLITPEFMRTYRRHACVIILILSAMITPPDVTSQFIIAIPLYGLYEIGILIAKRVYKPV